MNPIQLIYLEGINNMLWESLSNTTVGLHYGYMGFFNPETCKENYYSLEESLQFKLYSADLVLPAVKIFSVMKKYELDSIDVNNMLASVKDDLFLIREPVSKKEIFSCSYLTMVDLLNDWLCNKSDCLVCRVKNVLPEMYSKAMAIREKFKVPDSINNSSLLLYSDYNQLSLVQ